jgi:hypothetical protein
MGGGGGGSIYLQWDTVKSYARLWPHLQWQANIYAVLTILATLWILPITFAMEPPAMVMKTINAALGTGDV